MIGRPLSTWQVISVLFRASARRWLNRAGHVFRRRRGGRSATPGKHRPGRIRAAVIGIMFLFVGLNVASMIVGKLATSLAERGDRFVVHSWTYRRIVRAAEKIDGADPTTQLKQRARVARALAEDLLDERSIADPVAALSPEQRAELDRRLRAFDRRGAAAFDQDRTALWFADYSSTARDPRVHMGLALLLMVTFLAALLMALGSANTDLGQVEWSMQWLFTLPVRARALFLAKVLEYTVLATTSWIMHLPLLFTMLWSIGGYGLWSIPLAIAATLYVNLLLALSRVLLETWLRKRFSLPALKNLQAICSALGIILFFAIYALGYVKVPASVRDALGALPPQLVWLPWSLPTILLDGGTSAAIASAIGLVGATAVTAAAILGGERLVRDGLVVGSSDRVRGRATAARVARLHGIVGRELTLLRRDRNRFVQTLVVPVLILGFQLVINPKLLSSATHDVRHASAFAFGVGAYVLIGSAFMVLRTEGSALWLLFTFPQRIERVLLHKAFVWGTVAAFYTVAVIIAFGVAGTVSFTFVVGSLSALVGVAIYTVIAAGIGILSTDPFSQDIRRIRGTSLYTYFLLAALYGYGFYAPAWTKLVLIIVCSLLAVAIWQIVRDRAPLLLDPVQLPPPRIALSDGLIAVLAFAVLQSIVGTASAGLPIAERLLVAFAVAGGIVSLAALFIFWRRKVPNILASIGVRAAPNAWPIARSMVVGIGAGLAAAAVLLLYREAIDLERMPGEPPVTIMVLAIIAAPLFEELIFRGLVFRGLRRSSSVTLAVLASAGIFAICHPPVAFVPVFGLGVATAVSFDRTGRLIAPILAHAVYNAIVMLS